MSTGILVSEGTCDGSYKTCSLTGSNHGSTVVAPVRTTWATTVNTLRVSGRRPAREP